MLYDSRAKVGTIAIAMATMLGTRPLPRTAASVIALSTVGKAMRASVSLIRMAEAKGGQKAAARAMSMSTALPVTTEMRAEKRAVRVPVMMRLSMSRPKWSQPRRWLAEGAVKRALRSMASGSYGV